MTDMSAWMIFFAGSFVFGLCVAFLVLTAIEMRRLGRAAGDRAQDQPPPAAAARRDNVIPLRAA
jgi:hypothetical protein